MAAEVRFTGFTPGARRLLASLERHNDRTWFASRKDRFTRELLEPMAALVVTATGALQAAGLPLVGDPRRSVFRIYRDVRFSPDKRPYRTHLAAYLSPDGGRATPGGVYVHVAARAAFLAAAFYQIDRPMLVRWRHAMAERPRNFRALTQALERRGLAIELPATSDDALVRMPRGFEKHAATELGPYFRLRSFVVRRQLAEADVSSTRLVDCIVELARDARPLLNFGWKLV